MCDLNWKRMCSNGGGGIPLTTTSKKTFNKDKNTNKSLNLEVAKVVATAARAVSNNNNNNNTQTRTKRKSKENNTLKESNNNQIDLDRPGLLQDNKDDDDVVDYFEKDNIIKEQEEIKIIPKTISGWFSRLNKPFIKQNDVVGRYIAVDCEMVGLEGGKSALGRVSLVNYHGSVILDMFCKPLEKIVDYRTQYSGLTPSLLKNGYKFNEVLEAVSLHITSVTFLVGHAIKNDLKILMMQHPKNKIRDTSSKVNCLRKILTNTTSIPSLKILAEKHLGLIIQNGSHDSVIDASVTMLIYRLNRKEWEEELIPNKKRNYNF